MEPLFKSASLLFVLLNPFLMSVYLTTLIRELDARTFAAVMRRAHLVAFTAFAFVAVAGERLFTDILHVRFASFLIFGGIVFLVIGIRSVFNGTHVLLQTRGLPAHVSGAVAMPFMIGPGTISASILAGAQQSRTGAVLAVALAVAASLASIIVFKHLLDSVRQRNEKLLARYLEVSGRIVALFTGTFAVEMIVRGIETLLRQHLA